MSYYKSKLPMIHSVTTSECGLACVAMLSVYHGHQTDLVALRKRYPVSINGMTLRTIMEVLRNLYLVPHAYQLGADGLLVLKTPCILHWNNNHFVVMRKISRSYVIIHDPSAGVRRISISEAQRNFSGTALEIERQAEFERLEDASSRLRLADFWALCAGFRPLFVKLFLLSIPIQALGLVLPQYVQLVVDKAIAAKDLSILWLLVLGFCATAIFRAILGAFREVLSHFVGITIGLQLKDHLLLHLLRLPSAFFATRTTGDIYSRFESLDRIREFLTGNAISLVVDSALLVGAAVFMVMYSPTLAVVVLVFVFLEMILRVSLIQKLKDLSDAQLNSYSQVNSHLLESIRVMETIKLFSRERQRQRMWREKSTGALEQDLKISRWQSFLASARDALSGVEQILVVGLAASFVLDGLFTVGMLFAFVAYKTLFISAFRGLFDKIIEFQMLGLHLERVSDLSHTETESELDAIQKNAATSARMDSSSISFEDIWFRYGTGEPWIVSDFSLTVKAGESVALVGPSGCGKTTLLKLGLGLAQPNKGRILIDSVDAAKLGPIGHRRHVSAVMQDDRLLTGTLAQNISFFGAEPDMRLIIHCARLACLHSEILRFPMGYETMVGDLECSLSGGQKQRLLIARALYKQPRILFLDEATSHVDSAKEESIVNAIEGLNMTRIIVAHRTETIQSVDRVVHIGRS